MARPTRTYAYWFDRFINELVGKQCDLASSGSRLYFSSGSRDQARTPNYIGPHKPVNDFE
jgi:hypothetical protein